MKAPGSRACVLHYVHKLCQLEGEGGCHLKVSKNIKRVFWRILLYSNRNKVKYVLDQHVHWGENDRLWISCNSFFISSFLIRNELYQPVVSIFFVKLGIISFLFNDLRIFNWKNVKSLFWILRNFRENLWYFLLRKLVWEDLHLQYYINTYHFFTWKHRPKGNSTFAEFGPSFFQLLDRAEFCKFHATIKF